ncbi:MAG: hypothetical protein GY865_11745 [candidate division Zixibacteria bacterium]|nr:hypothetical protein [candidate division Zixibacteria bacterium]
MKDKRLQSIKESMAEAIGNIDDCDYGEAISNLIIGDVLIDELIAEKKNEINLDKPKF